MQLLPHPVNFAWWTLVDDPYTGTTGDFHSVLNPQLAGTTHAEKFASLSGSWERYRLAYASVTGYFDGPALANQGTISAAQTPTNPRLVNVSTSTATNTYMIRHVRVTDGLMNSVMASDFPQTARIVSMPNVYTGEAKEGFYMPLHLTRTSQQWVGAAESEYWAMQTGGSTTGQVVVARDDTLYNMYWPHPGLQACHQTTSDGPFTGHPTAPLLSDTVGVITGRNISPQAGFVLQFRFGFEVVAEPGTTLSPFLKMPPTPDEAAIAAYYFIVRQLKDAYPADHNDLGKIWNVIRKALPVAARAVGNAFLGPAATSALESAGRAIFSSSGKETSHGGAKTMSATNVQEVQKQNQRILDRPIAVRRKPSRSTARKPKSARAGKVWVQNPSFKPKAS